MVWDLCALCESLLYIESDSMSHLCQSNLLDCCYVHALGFTISLAPKAIRLDLKYE